MVCERLLLGLLENYIMPKDDSVIMKLSFDIPHLKDSTKPPLSYFCSSTQFCFHSSSFYCQQKPLLTLNQPPTYTQGRPVITEDSEMAGLHSSCPAEQSSRKKNVLDHCSLTCLADLIGIH